MGSSDDWDAGDDGRAGMGKAAGLEELIGLYISTLQGLIATLPASEEGFEEERALWGDEKRIMFLLAKAQAVWLTSGLRYWRQVADIMADRGMSLTDVVTASMVEGKDPVVRNIALLDEARIALREVAELSMSEAKSLRRKLLEIEEKLRESEAAQAEEGRRFHKVKPS
ncbi:MAG: hypothetical protein AAFW69_08500 [Pseudomonadota bacterium]